MICTKCEMMEHACICPIPTDIPYFCCDCKSTGEPRLEIETGEGLQLAFPYCSFCGSDNIKPADEIIDAAEHVNGDR